LILLTAGLLFGLSATASWTMRKSSAETDELDSTAETEPVADSAEADLVEPAGPADATLSEPPAEPAPSSVVSATTQAAPDLPVPLRPSYVVGAEETVQLATRLRDRAAAVKEREAQLTTRQTQLQLIVEDIRAERAAIDELRKQIQEELRAVADQTRLLEEKKLETEQRQTELENRQQGIESRLTQLDSEERGNVKKIAAVYDTMPPESASKILLQLCDGGNMDTAVKLLGLMKERQAAKVLAEFPDPDLAAQLTLKLKGLKRAPAPTTPE
jgi:flagellar motility protein MotE (MotC chaperone)